jgi:hypothetical protein
VKFIPPPTSFAEGQRAVALWAMILAGMFAGVMIIAILAVLIWGGWPVYLYRLIIYVIAGALAGFVVSMVAVILALAVGGPVGRFKVDANRSGVGFDLSGDQTAATVTTTTAVTTPAKGAGE